MANKCTYYKDMPLEKDFCKYCSNFSLFRLKVHKPIFSKRFAFITRFGQTTPKINPMCLWLWFSFYAALL